jgi:hypothetical protein
MSQAREPGRLPISLITYVAWTMVTIFGMRWAGDGTKKPLIESVTHSISWNLVMAVAACVRAWPCGRQSCSRQRCSARCTS